MVDTARHYFVLKKAVGLGREVAVDKVDVKLIKLVEVGTDYLMHVVWMMTLDCLKLAPDLF